MCHTHVTFYEEFIRVNAKDLSYFSNKMINGIVQFRRINNFYKYNKQKENRLGIFFTFNDDFLFFS